MRLRRAPLLAVVLSTAGCDALFSVDRVPAVGDAFAMDGTSDGTSIDDAMSMVDAKPCGTTFHDEDNDGLYDDCDACPTVSSTMADSDGDGLANECDPNLSTSVDGDAIKLATVFKSSTDLSNNYDTAGTASATVANDRVVLPAGAQIQLKAALLPTQIVAEVAAFSGTSSSQTILIGANGISCEIGAAGCGNEAGLMCVSFNSAGQTLSSPASALKRITLSHDNNGGLSCTLLVQGNSLVFTVTGSWTNSIPFVRTSGANAELESLVFYVEK